MCNRSLRIISCFIDGTEVMVAYLVCYKHYTLLSTVKSFCETGSLTIEKMKKMNVIGLTFIVVTTSAMTIAFETVAVSIKSPERISQLSIVLKIYYYIVTTLSFLICIFLVKIFLLLKFTITRASDRSTLGVKRGIVLFCPKS